MVFTVNLQLGVTIFSADGGPGKILSSDAENEPTSKKTDKSTPYSDFLVLSLVILLFLNIILKLVTETNWLILF
jgi:hypothetical protein